MVVNTLTKGFKLLQEADAAKRKILLLVDRLLPDVDGRLVLALLLRRRFLGRGRWLVVQYWHALCLVEKDILN